MNAENSSEAPMEPARHFTAGFEDQILTDSAASDGELLSRLKAPPLHHGPVLATRQFVRPSTPAEANFSFVFDRPTYIKQPQIHATKEETSTQQHAQASVQPRHTNAQPRRTYRAPRPDLGMQRSINVPRSPNGPVRVNNSRNTKLPVQVSETLRFNLSLPSANAVSSDPPLPTAPPQEQKYSSISSAELQTLTVSRSPSVPSDDHRMTSSAELPAALPYVDNKTSDKNLLSELLESLQKRANETEEEQRKCNEEKAQWKDKANSLSADLKTREDQYNELLREKEIEGRTRQTLEKQAAEDLATARSAISQLAQDFQHTKDAINGVQALMKSHPTSEVSQTILNKVGELAGNLDEKHNESLNNLGAQFETVNTTLTSFVSQIAQLSSTMQALHKTEEPDAGLPLAPIQTGLEEIRQAIRDLQGANDTTEADGRLEVIQSQIGTVAASVGQVFSIISAPGGDPQIIEHLAAISENLKQLQNRPQPEATVPIFDTDAMVNKIHETLSARVEGISASAALANDRSSEILTTVQRALSLQSQDLAAKEVIIDALRTQLHDCHSRTNEAIGKHDLLLQENLQLKHEALRAGEDSTAALKKLEKAEHQASEFQVKLTVSDLTAQSARGQVAGMTEQISKLEKRDLKAAAAPNRTSDSDVLSSFELYKEEVATKLLQQSKEMEALHAHNAALMEQIRQTDHHQKQASDMEEQMTEMAAKLTSGHSEFQTLQLRITEQDLAISRFSEALRQNESLKPQSHNNGDAPQQKEVTQSPLQGGQNSKRPDKYAAQTTVPGELELLEKQRPSSGLSEAASIEDLSESTLEDLLRDMYDKVIPEAAGGEGPNTPMAGTESSVRPNSSSKRQGGKDAAPKSRQDLKGMKRSGKFLCTAKPPVRELDNGENDAVSESEVEDLLETSVGIRSTASRRNNPQKLPSLVDTTTERLFGSKRSLGHTASSSPLKRKAPQEAEFHGLGSGPLKKFARPSPTGGTAASGQNVRTRSSGLRRDRTPATDKPDSGPTGSVARSKKNQKKYDEAFARELSSQSKRR